MIARGRKSCERLNRTTGPPSPHRFEACTQHQPGSSTQNIFMNQNSSRRASSSSSRRAGVIPVELFSGITLLRRLPHSRSRASPPRGLQLAPSLSHPSDIETREPVHSERGTRFQVGTLCLCVRGISPRSLVCPRPRPRKGEAGRSSNANHDSASLRMRHAPTRRSLCRLPFTFVLLVVPSTDGNGLDGSER
jgi:hypothetical protein